MAVASGAGTVTVEAKAMVAESIMTTGGVANLAVLRRRATAASRARHAAHSPHPVRGFASNAVLRSHRLFVVAAATR